MHDIAVSRVERNSTAVTAIGWSCRQTPIRARRYRSAEKVMLFAQSVCSLIVQSSCPSGIRHRAMLPSNEASPSHEPFGEKAMSLQRNPSFGLCKV